MNDKKWIDKAYADENDACTPLNTLIAKGRATFDIYSRGFYETGSGTYLEGRKILNDFGSTSETPFNRFYKGFDDCEQWNRDYWEYSIGIDTDNDGLDDKGLLCQISDAADLGDFRARMHSFIMDDVYDPLNPDPIIYHEYDDPSTYAYPHAPYSTIPTCNSGEEYTGSDPPAPGGYWDGTDNLFDYKPEPDNRSLCNHSSWSRMNDGQLITALLKYIDPNSAWINENNGDPIEKLKATPGELGQMGEYPDDPTQTPTFDDEKYNPQPQQKMASLSDGIDGSIAVYPNPTAENRVFVDGLDKVNIQFVRMVNLYGREVPSRLDVNGKTLEFSPATPSSTYIIELFLENGEVYRKKLVYLDEK